MMEKFVGVSWQKIRPDGLRKGYEAFYLFSDAAYSEFLPSILNCALLSYDDSHSAVYCLVRDIAECDERRCLVFESELKTGQLKVILAVFESDCFKKKFEEYEDDSPILAKASKRLLSLLSSRS